MKGELLLEIGTEEIPAGFLLPALEGLKKNMEAELAAQRIRFDGIITMGTPRRLTLCVQGIREKQGDNFVDAMGPPEKVAFDEKGNPTKAAKGFAARQGVSFSDLEVVETKKGKYIRVRKKIVGKETFPLLSPILIKVIMNIPFPKSMRWADLDLRFARPIKWILAIFNGKIIPFRLGNLESTNRSWGHRFLNNKSFLVYNLQNYLHQTEAHFVIPEIKKRKEVIQNEAYKLAEEVGGKVLEDEELLNTVTNLVEYPVALRGSFDPEYLSLPREVLISAMKEHQKYFAVEDSAGKLLPYFIVITNTKVLNPQIVIEGNERVLSARLADARFFFNEDRKVKLSDRVEDLKQVVYQAKLGSMYDKVSRLIKLAGYLSRDPNGKFREKLQRAAFLCKADLLTEMVGEFPSLQGVMGREYALLDGESPEVAEAIYEHYLPTTGKGELPATDIGSLLSIADKIDSIVGCFGIGLIPTGTADPHALRRQALGVIGIILAKRLSLNLPALIGKSVELFNNRLTRGKDEIKREVLEFIRARFQQRMISSGYSYDVVKAVTSINFIDLIDVFSRVKSLQEMKSHPDFEPLVITFKRIANIIDASWQEEVDPSLFKEEAEKALHDSYQRVGSRIHQLMEARDYAAILSHLTRLKPSVDRFFDEVLVMCEDSKIKLNRLGLLRKVFSLFQVIADFSKIVTEGR